MEAREQAVDLTEFGVDVDAPAPVVVVNFGYKIAEGAPADVRKDKDVQLAYLGGDA